MVSDSSKRKCSRCGKAFKSRKDTDNHIKDMHKGKGHRVPVSNRNDDEPSLGDQLAEAEFDRAAGLPVEDWLKNMMG